MGSKVKLGIEDPNGYEVGDQLRKKIDYPEELQEKIYEAEFWVEAPYHIVEVNDRKWIQPVNLDKAKDDKDDSILSKSPYNPFDNPHLFLKAAKVDTNDEKSILGFCNEYGLFRNKPLLSFSTKPPAERRLPLDFFIQKIEGIKDTLKKVDAIQRKDTYEVNRYQEDIIQTIESLRVGQLSKIDKNIEILKRTKADMEETDPQIRQLTKQWMETNFGVGSSYDPGEDLKKAYELREEINSIYDGILKRAKGDPLLMFKQNLLKTINSEIESVFPTVKLGLNGEFVPGYTSNSLLSVIYFQISEMVKNSQPLEECLLCRSMFTPRKAGSKFCPSETPGGRSKCQNRYEVMKHRAKKAIEEGSKTVEDICRQYKRPFAEVMSWIEDAEMTS